MYAGTLPIRGKLSRSFLRRDFAMRARNRAAGDIPVLDSVGTAMDRDPEATGDLVTTTP